MAEQRAGWKDDSGKLPMDLIAPELLEGVAEVLEHGRLKYGSRNWEGGMRWGRVFAAMMRHMVRWWAGEQYDPESGLPHLAHAACCVMFLMAYEDRGIGEDDRKKPEPVEPETPPQIEPSADGSTATFLEEFVVAEDIGMNPFRGQKIMQVQNPVPPILPHQGTSVVQPSLPVRGEGAAIKSELVGAIENWPENGSGLTA